MAVLPGRMERGAPGFPFSLPPMHYAAFWPQFPQRLLGRGWKRVQCARPFLPLPPRPPTALPPATTPEIPKVCGIIELEPLVNDQGQ